MRGADPGHVRRARHDFRPSPLSHLPRQLRSPHDKDRCQEPRRIQRPARAGAPASARAREQGGGRGDGTRLGHRHTAHRQQPGRGPAQKARREQGQRVQIGGPAQQPPVQAPRRAVRRPRLDRRHDLARAHLRTRGHRRADRLVGRAQGRVARTGEGDREHAAARDPARERDPARRRGPHGGARCGGQIHPAVPRPVHRGRRFPAAHDRGTWWPQRPAPLTRAVGPGLARGHAEQARDHSEKSSVHA